MANVDFIANQSIVIIVSYGSLPLGEHKIMYFAMWLSLSLSLGCVHNCRWSKSCADVVLVVVFVMLFAIVSQTGDMLLPDVNKSFFLSLSFFSLIFFCSLPHSQATGQNWQGSIQCNRDGFIARTNIVFLSIAIHFSFLFSYFLSLSTIISNDISHGFSSTLFLFIFFCFLSLKITNKLNKEREGEGEGEKEIKFFVCFWACFSFNPFL